MKFKRPYERFNGLVAGQYKAERSLPIGNPCDSELSNLMRCMRENDYDNVPCLDLQQMYLSCAKEALEIYKEKRDRFLSGQQTDGMYSQKVINEEFKKIKQPIDKVAWKMQSYYLQKKNLDYQPSVDALELYHPHICAVPRDLNFDHNISKTGPTKKDLI